MLAVDKVTSNHSNTCPKLGSPCHLLLHQRYYLMVFILSHSLWEIPSCGRLSQSWSLGSRWPLQCAGCAPPHTWPQERGTSHNLHPVQSVWKLTYLAEWNWTPCVKNHTDQLMKELFPAEWLPISSTVIFFLGASSFTPTESATEISPVNKNTNPKHHWMQFV